MSHPTKKEPVVLIIAGSDPSGGAGIQADIKTCAVLGVYCGAAITAITCQNTKRVAAIHPLAADLVRAQIIPVFDDLQVSHIKIGMVGSKAVAEMLVALLAGFDGEIIYDPVALSSSGDPLFAENSEEALKKLARRATVLTPNIGEMELLSGCPCPNERQAIKAAQQLLDASPSLKAVCVKGGHMEENGSTVTDLLLIGPKVAKKEATQLHAARHPRIVSSNTHGTGCSFASAYTAFHYRTGDHVQAFHLASRFLHDLIKESATVTLGEGNGPLLHHLGGTVR